MLRFRLLLIAIIFPLAGCSVDAILDPGAHAEKSVVAAPADGSVITPAEGLPIVLDYPSGAGEAEKTGHSLNAVIYDGQDRSVGTRKLDPRAFEAGEAPVLDLSELKAGFYRMNMTLSKAGGTVSERRFKFFVAADRPKAVGTVVYPVSLRPKSSGIIQALFTAPEDTRPFIRWSMEGKVIKEASVANGGDLLPWTAPAQEGVYSIKMELFPFPPPRGKSFDFQSPESFMAKLFVSSTYRPLGNDFVPAEDFYSLLHFSGDSTDFGSLQRGLREPVRADAIGAPKLQLQQGVFGYFLDGESGFRLANPPWPVGEKAATPLVFQLRLLPSAPAVSKSIFRFTSEDSSFGLGTGEDEALVFTSSSGQTSASVKFGHKLKSGRPVVLALTVTPFGDSWNVGLDVDGELVERSAIGAPFAAWPSIGELSIAGAGGFSGIIDEFGVRVRR